MSEKKISSKFIYFFGAFGGILFGYDIGVMTGALPFLQSDWNLSGGGVTGWITSSLMLGAVFGGAIAGQLSDRLGRRKMVLYSALLFMVGALLAGVSPHDGVAYLIFTRVLLGVAVGAASALVPAYMSEMAPAEKRGSLSGINQLMIVSGMLISYVVDFLLKGLPEHIAWRLMLALAAVPALILFLGVLRLPESPRFLIKAGRVEEAHKVLTWIRRPEEIDGEINAINETARIEQKAEKSTSWGSLLEGRYRYLVIAGVMVAFFQQFMGANAIFYYIPLIVEKASGQAASDALLWPIIQGVILVLGALLYMAIAEKFNRRGLLMMGGTVMGLSFILPAVINSFMDTNPMMIVVFLSIFVAFYAFTWAPLTWVLVGEVFPLAIRGRASGLASSMNWVGSFVVALIFPIMTASMSQEAVFAIFGVICLVAVAFVMFRVPETRGHSLEEIEKLGAEKEAK
ncbi:sugar porter family MFS transporter [Weissella paramesenteroides]|jgi:sugar porter (SP) family MFS transporter|uniref:Sugar porter family MFS transporter n=1 Tax=Weissella paramesenteroides TaxID=1249 RepID=A0ABD4XG84_WEIPA|nr:sugar porter family MFS transporter [Weissella paramesenteroides]MBU7556244.1 sugar porter family MFS transporter [Weissella paramesenteroides]MDF8366403.1 sugar porter family MFS transporter [Weissella paramesenteroides]MDF8368199.1 sugar porter family MFS transporter [Weissella paramesenteroides]MDF8370215.1 sugar porter family MFS transporter [Weissella paramesenteroides]MDF8373072.1 sugar porter family MFS transporter [Weissella paramesenteroides]